MLIAKNNITSVIPQRAPFVMIDELISATPEGFETRFLVHADNIFIKDNTLTEGALIENIAQTCAAGFGYLQRNENSEPRIGFIGGISKLIVHSLPHINQQVETKVSVLYQLDNVNLVKGESFVNGQLLLECEMKIVVM